MLRRSAVATAVLLAVSMVAPGSALAGILSEATASASVNTARWSAIPTSSGGTSLTTSFQTGYGEKGTRYAIVDIYNSGTVAVSGFTLTGSRGGSGNGIVQACPEGWTAPAKAKDVPLCGGSEAGSSVGSVQPGRGVAVAASIPPGGPPLPAPPEQQYDVDPVRRRDGLTYQGEP
jgi:hypothetical protein